MVSLGMEDLVAWYFDHREAVLASFKSVSKDGARAAIDKLYDAWSMLGMQHRMPFLPDDILRELGLDIQVLRDQRQSHLLLEWAAMDARFTDLKASLDGAGGQGEEGEDGDGGEDAALLRTARSFASSSSAIRAAFVDISKGGAGKLAPVAGLHAALQRIGSTISHDDFGVDVFSALGLDMAQLTATGKSGQLIAWDDLSSHMASLLEGVEGGGEDDYEDDYAEDKEEGKEVPDEVEEGGGGGGSHAPVPAPAATPGAAGTAPARDPAAARLQAGLPPTASDSTYSVPVDEDEDGETSLGDIDESKVPDKRPHALGSSGGKARPQSAPRQRPASAQQQFGVPHRSPDPDVDVVDDDEVEEEGAGGVAVDSVEDDGYDDEEFVADSPQRAGGGGGFPKGEVQEEEVEDDYGSDFD